MGYNSLYLKGKSFPTKESSLYRKPKTLSSKDKNQLLFALNFLLFPYVVGHLDNRDYACEFAVVKRNCTAFRGVGESRWNIHNPETTIDNCVTVVTPRSNDWQSFNFKTFKEIFEKEQFQHPIRAAIIEILYQL